MPLDSLEAYERLGEHLAQIDAPLAEFSARYGYTLYPKLSGGRYPNRRITQEQKVMRSIHIQMDLTLEGNRYDQFFPEIPYTTWGGTWIDDFTRKIRWLGPSISLQRIPFSNLRADLNLHLNHFHGYLSGISEDYVKACCCIVPLSSPA
jgi:hypothetical protein